MQNIRVVNDQEYSCYGHEKKQKSTGENMSNAKVGKNIYIKKVPCKIIMFVWSQEYLLVFLMVISGGVSQIEECDAESQIKLSALSALRHSLVMKNTMMMQLQASIDIKEAEMTQLKEYMNTTEDEAETLINAIHNKTIPDIQKLELTCEDAFARDCCEVLSIIDRGNRFSV